MRILRVALQLAFYMVVLALFVSRGVSAGFSHDENQFIAAGQLLADHGLLPYVHYPYTHMPYGAFFYALTAKLSPYDFLLGRLFNAAAWFGCSLLIAKAFLPPGERIRSAPPWFWEFTVVYLFLNNPILDHILGNALNHSLASLFSLLALAFFIRATLPSTTSLVPSFLAGAFVCLAGLTRFNYASLVVVLGVLIALQQRLSPRQLPARSAVAFWAGVAAGAVPALVLFIAAPTAFLYGNLVYIRLNAIYYGNLLYRVNMQLGQKLLDFLTYLIATPVDLALYVLVLFTLVRSIVWYSSSRSGSDLNRLAMAACAMTLALTAFAPSPTQPQYFLAAIPILFVALSSAGAEIHVKSRFGLAALAVLLLVALHETVTVRSPIAAARELGRPSNWTPLQAHYFAESLRKYVPAGRILSLLPMLPLEAGYPVYPFAATGPFSWRTSLLLTADRRAQYGVTSPEELRGLLAHQPPKAILTGFESTNAGFVRNDLGGLESPFLEYARLNGFRSIPLPAPFLEQSITLWIRPP